MASKKNKWKLTDSLKDKIAEMAKKDAQNNEYMGNEFKSLRKSEISKVAPDRAALIEKFSYLTGSGNASVMKEVHSVGILGLFVCKREVTTFFQKKGYFIDPFTKFVTFFVGDNFGYKSLTIWEG